MTWFSKSEGGYTLNRESVLITLVACGAVIGYLQASPKSPLEWSYPEWLQAISAGVLWAMARLGPSPLKGKDD